MLRLGTRAARATYTGVVEKIPYLLDLGVTVVELMPVFQCLISPSDFCEPGAEVPLQSSSYTVEARSIVVLMH